VRYRIVAAVAACLVVTGCSGSSSDVPEDTAAANPIVEVSEDTVDEGDAAAELALQACEAYHASYRSGGAGATDQARRFADAAADADPTWIPLASQISTAVDRRETPGSREASVALAEFAELDEVHRQLGQVCLDEFGLTVKFANNVALIDAGT
jgi:hypothetical protein